MNILVATPGRLIQYMDHCRVLLRQSSDARCALYKSHRYTFITADPCSTKLIVFLTWGFSRTLSALFGHLPKSRQTLLFSATQTQSVSDLARLSLRDSVFMSTDAAASTTEGSTHLELPSGIEQHYAICGLESNYRRTLVVHQISPRKQDRNLSLFREISALHL